MTFDPRPMDLLPALDYWLRTVGGIALIVLLTSLMSVGVSHRGAAIKLFGGELVGCLKDLISLSPRRVWAVAKLTFMEAYRRKALAVFVIFALLFMFAGWFMGGETGEITPDHVTVYVSFVLRTISWLTLPLVLVLSSFGIPEDIRLRSIHTVVTKPARRLEIVLGRVLGFSLVGTLVLGVMSVVGWLWIVRQIPSELLVCRVPVYGSLEFRDRSGNPAAAGVNTGDIWEFRSYIEGATKARAIWTFSNISERSLDSEGNLHLENEFLAFRSYKGDMKRSLLYDYQLINKKTGQSYTLPARPVNENRSAKDVVPRKLVDDAQKKEYDLIKDFVTDGKLTVEVSCIDREQYLGMARPDLFIRMPDLGFESGYFKAVLGIEILMVLVVLLAVTGSTFLKGPIAALLTAVILILGGKDCHEFMDQLVLGRTSATEGFRGGGFFESVYRIVTHMNPTTELPQNPAFTIMKYTDGFLTDFLWLDKQVIPRLEFFNMAEYVSKGFDVPFDSSLLPSLMILLGYFIPCVLLGYFALRIRELESK